MSKTQEKRARRMQESADFILERRKMQLGMFEQSHKVGLKLYEDHKDDLQPADIEALEKQIKENEAIIEKLKSEIYPTTEA